MYECPTSGNSKETAILDPTENIPDDSPKWKKCHSNCPIKGSDIPIQTTENIPSYETAKETPISYDTSEGTSSKATIGGVAGGLILLLVIGIIIAYYVYQKRKQTAIAPKEPQNDSPGEDKPAEENFYDDYGGEENYYDDYEECHEMTEKKQGKTEALACHADEEKSEPDSEIPVYYADEDKPENNCPVPTYYADGNTSKPNSPVIPTYYADGDNSEPNSAGIPTYYADE